MKAVLRYLAILLFVAALVCFFYVYPGVWRYKQTELHERMYRTDRLTGQVERWAETGFTSGSDTVATQNHWHKGWPCPFCEKYAGL